MMYTQILVKQIRGDRARKKAAREELWKGQCNQTYWHTPFGGIYQNNLRKKAYKALLDAEKITQEKGIFIPSIVTADFDMDGETEYLYQGYELNAYAHLHGGMIFELDYLPASWNYLDTFSRYPELYHSKECQNKGVDWYPRKAFVDHFLNEKEHISQFDAMSYQELGNFVDAAYDVTMLHREQKVLELRKNGSIIVKKKHIPIQLTKVFRFRKNSFSCTYTILNESGEDVQTTFGSEINLSFGSNCVETLRFNTEQDNKMSEIALTPVEVSKVSALQLNDISNKVEVSIRMDQPCRLWSLPVETCYLTQEDFEKQYQSSCFLTMWNVQLSPKESWTNSITLSFSKIKKS